MSYKQRSPIIVAEGGTGAQTLTGVLTGNGTGAITANAVTQYGTIVAGASNTVTSVAPSATSGVPLISQGASANPAYGTAVVAGGGTGVTTMTTAYAPVCAGTTATGALQVASTGLATSGFVLTSTGAGSLPTFQAPASSSISITGDSGGALTGTSFTFTGGTTGLSFGGSGSTQTLTFAGITANGGTVSLATDATTSTINVGTGAGVKTSTFGSTNSTSATTVQSGSGALAVTSTNGTLTINSGTGALSISSDASATTVNIATGGAVKTTTLGSTNSTSATTVRSGSGALALTSTNGTWTGNSGTGALGLSTDASATTISLGTGAAVKTITLGSTNTSSTTTIQGGTGGIQLSGTFVNMPTTTSTVGQIRVNNDRYFHAYGTNNVYVGRTSGNFTLTGDENTCVGYNTGLAITSGDENVAIGSQTFVNNTIGIQNTAVGRGALYACTEGDGNVVVGRNSLNALTTGDNNVVVGTGSGTGITTGLGNIFLGAATGTAFTGSDSYNIYMNHPGNAGESNILRIGLSTGTGAGQLDTAIISGIRGITTFFNDAVAVLIDSNGQLGTVSSSIRYKENIIDMGDVSSPVLNLRPVTFDFIGKPSHKKQIGLIAEEVKEIMPDLVVHNQDGEVESVKYHELPVLLLNELQKLRKEVEELKAKLK